MKILVHYSSMKNIRFKGTIEAGDTDDWNLPEDMRVTNMMDLLYREEEFHQQVLDSLVEYVIEIVED